MTTNPKILIVKRRAREDGMCNFCDDQLNIPLQGRSDYYVKDEPVILMQGKSASMRACYRCAREIEILLRTELDT
jgi:hypothetical protein